jgi:agmatinase
MENFDPNGVGIANGNYFGLPCSLEESKVALISVPWDVTVSYGEGTSKGPGSIMDVSVMFDLFDLSVDRAWEYCIGTVPEKEELKELNCKTRLLAKSVIDRLAEGASEEELSSEIDSVNSACERMNDYVFNQSFALLRQGKIPGIVGGEHSVPFGQIKAVAEHYGNVGILHIDAHADLREAYEGFRYSHASIMYNVLKEIPQVSKLCQVAIRDFCAEEHKIIINEQRVRSFTDFELRNAEFDGLSWNKVCDSIISTLPDNVYISFDIDGLSPDLCPNTGTPVPGGLTFNKADHLLVKLMNSGKKIVGFDLVEVAPGEDNEWDANVGAKLLYKMCLYAARTCD